jgi:hypothetical protein
MNINQARETADQLHILLSYLYEDAADADDWGKVAEVNIEDAGTLLDLINTLTEALHDEPR